MAAARGRKSSPRSKHAARIAGSGLHANLIAGTSYTSRVGRRWQEDWPGALGERGVVPYLQPRAHKCILTDAFESRARPWGPVTRRIGTRMHLSGLRDTQIQILNNVRHTPTACAPTYIIHKSAGVRATSGGKQRTTPATLFHEHNLHYRTVQPVNSGASRGAHARPHPALSFSLSLLPSGDGIWIFLICSARGRLTNLIYYPATSPLGLSLSTYAALLSLSLFPSPFLRPSRSVHRAGWGSSFADQNSGYLSLLTLRRFLLTARRLTGSGRIPNATLWIRGPPASRCTDRNQRILCVAPAISLFPDGFLVPDRSPEFCYWRGTWELPRRYNDASEPREMHGRENKMQGCVTTAADGAAGFILVGVRARLRKSNTLR